MKFVVVALALASLQPAPYDAVLAKLDAYLADYEPKLSELIADEAMSQEMQGANATVAQSVDLAPLPGNATIRRQLRSEVAFVALPDNSGWLGFRHVKTVNRSPIKEGASLTSLLSASGFERARALLVSSAAYNLGFPRSTNLPNLPLEFLHRRNRHRLEPRLDGHERILGVDAVRLVFQEKATPTLISSPQGGDMPSMVRAWIDPDNGRLLRAAVTTLKNAQTTEFENSIDVEFGREKDLGLLVPKVMKETFPGSPGKGKGTARYTNYRRFTTSARIVPQP